MKPRHFLPAAALLAACGGSNASAPPATTTATTLAPTTTTAPTTTAAPTTTIPARPTFGQIVKDCATKLWDPKATGYVPGRDEFLALGDNGNTIEMTIGSGGDHDVSGAGLACVLDAIKMPKFDQNRMNQTRALDGMVTAQWDGYRASWTYHPDNGLTVDIEDTTL